GLAFPSSGHEVSIGRQLGCGQGAVELQVEVEAAQAERVGQQHLGVESGGVGSVLLEVIGGELQDLNNRHQWTTSGPAPVSWAARSTATSTQTISSRSPCMTRSSLCRVRLMRWSVTRFSLKL